MAPLGVDVVVTEAANIMEQRMKSEPTVRDIVMSAIGDDEFTTSAAVVHRTGLPAKTVNTTISALVRRMGLLERVDTPSGVKYRKVHGKYGECSHPPMPDFQDLELKLAQLRSHRNDLRKAGLSLVDELIEDLIVLTHAVDSRRTQGARLTSKAQHDQTATQ